MARKKKLGKLKVMMLGGLNEIGKNLAVIEYENDIIMIDCGLGFPDEDMLGVDLVIPDTTYLEKNATGYADFSLRTDTRTTSGRSRTFSASSIFRSTARV